MHWGGHGTVEVLEFVKSCFGHEAGVVKEIGGWKAGWEERARGIVQASHAEERDRVVRLSCYCNAALTKVFQIRLIELDEPMEKGVKGPISRKSAALP